MIPKTKIALVTPELSPLAKAGKAAEFSSALLENLTGLGIEVSVFLPKYRTPKIESWPMETAAAELWVPLGGERIKAAVYRSELKGSAVYFVDNAKYFLRERIYGPDGSDYLDNDERFIFFCRAVPEFLLQAGLYVDLVHCVQWPTALIPVFLKTHYAGASFFRGVASVLSLPSQDDRGEFPAESLAWTGLDWDMFTPQNLVLNGKFSFLKAGLIFSDAIGVAEIDSPKASRAGRPGPGLNEILQSRKDVCSSIRNGNDYRQYIGLYRKALDHRKGG